PRPRQPQALASRRAVASPPGRTLLPAKPGVGRSTPPYGPGQFSGRESQQSPARLLLSASPPRQRLPVASAVLPQPSPLSAERAPRTGRQKPGRIAERSEPSTLAGTARLHAILSKLIGQPAINL